jgi:hypothetical protein
MRAPKEFNVMKNKIQRFIDMLDAMEDGIVVINGDYI